MTPTTDVIVVGAGQAGAQVAISLRKDGFSGSIVVVGDEIAEPYSRPLLSKEYLTSPSEPHDLLLRDTGYWASAGIQLQLDTAISAVDADGAITVSVTNYTYSPITPIATFVGMGTIHVSRQAVLRWERSS